MKIEPQCEKISSKLWKIRVNKVSMIVEYDGNCKKELLNIFYNKLHSGETVEKPAHRDFYDLDDEVLD